MARNKGIMLALRRFGESGNAAEGPQLPELLLPSRQNLMDIGLVAHIKDNAVLGCIKYQMQRQRQLHYTQVGGQVAAGTGDVFHQELPDLPAELLLLLRCQLQQRLAGVDRIQQCQNVTTILSCSESKTRLCNI